MEIAVYTDHKPLTDADAVIHISGRHASAGSCGKVEPATSITLQAQTFYD
jgi:hypothetical protein